MKTNLEYVGYAIWLLFSLSTIRVSAQMPRRTASASDEEIKKAYANMKAAPHSLEACESYVYAIGIKNPHLNAIYGDLTKKYPGNVTIPLAFGTVFYNAEMPQAKKYLLKVAQMQPNNAEVWSMLSFDAVRWGQNDLAAAYIGKASLAEPSNPDYAANYLAYFEDGEPDNYKQKVFDFVKRFPTSERGAQALNFLGQNAVNVNDKISYFETLRKLYPPQKSDWSTWSMNGLADAYMQTDPEKALMLINEMGDEKDWKLRKQVAVSLIQVGKLTQNQKFKDAIVELDKVKLPQFNFINEFILLKKACLREQAGDVKAAYDSIAVKFAVQPTDVLYAALELYGKKAGKDNRQIENDIAAIRVSTATTAYPFNLDVYGGNGKLNLKDLKGKVVLLTFWFPGCGPCRMEFPHFQAVIDKFKGVKVIYIGINVTSEQDPYVLSFLKNTKYSFIPLRGSATFAANNYGVNSEPANFLIDKDGKIIFKDFNIGKANQRTLELMIASLLQKGQQTN